MHDLYLNSVIARWLQEAKRLRDSAKEAPPHQLFDQAVLSWEIQASIFEKCAKEISEALKADKMPKGPADDAGQVGWMGGEFDR